MKPCPICGCNPCRRDCASRRRCRGCYDQDYTHDSTCPKFKPPFEWSKQPTDNKQALRAWLEDMLERWLVEYRIASKAGRERDALQAFSHLEAYKNVLGEMDRQAYIHSREHQSSTEEDVHGD